MWSTSLSEPFQSHNVLGTRHRVKSAHPFAEGIPHQGFDQTRVQFIGLAECSASTQQAMGSQCQGSHFYGTPETRRSGVSPNGNHLRKLVHQNGPNQTLEQASPKPSAPNEATSASSPPLHAVRMRANTNGLRAEMQLSTSHPMWVATTTS